MVGLFQRSYASGEYWLMKIYTQNRHNNILYVASNGFGEAKENDG
jgi:hypothetical protein